MLGLRIFALSGFIITFVHMYKSAGNVNNKLAARVDPASAAI
jgi:hypothetical protein